MKKLTRRLLIFTLTFAMLFSMCGNAFAVDANRTYSIGCKYVGGQHDGDDCTPNVNNAYLNYSKMPYYSSFKSTMPTSSSMTKIFEDSGLRMIGHKVAFLNGHANWSCMVFQAKNETAYRTGIYYGEDGARTNEWGSFGFAGIQSTNLNYSKLMTLVGCKTANTEKTTYNIAYNAHAKGSDTVVGFKTTIYSRPAQGQNWCNAYNYFLRLGHSVQSALILATEKYGIGNNLSQYHIYGSTATTITAKTAAKSSSEIAPSHLLDDIMYVKDINVPMDTESMKDCCEVSVADSGIDLSGIIKGIKEIDDTFNPNDYKVTINIYAPQEKTGVITFNYCIGNKILTNKTYSIPIINNTANQILINKMFISNEKAKSGKLVSHDDKLSNELLSLVENFENQGKNNVMSENNINGKIESHDQNYIYDYHSDVLYYQDALCYEEPELYDTIVDKYTIKYLRGSEKDLLSDANSEM